MSKPQPKCPIRPGDPCSLCTPGADGPHNCGLVYLVMDDPELRELYVAKHREQRAARLAAAAATANSATESGR